MEEQELYQTRLHKMDQLRELGVDPFGHRYEPTHHANEIHQYGEDKTKEQLDEAPFRVKLAGRLMIKRGHGKASFAVLQDRTGTIQIYAKVDVLGNRLMRSLS